MRVLFLDFDGVLNNTHWLVSEHRRRLRAETLGKRTPRYDRTHEFDPRNVRWLNHVMDMVPDLRIVVSSSWRGGMTVPELRELLRRVGLREADRVIDKTGHAASRQRHEEIRAWMDANNPSFQFAAIDDDIQDMLPLGRNFFHVPSKRGLLRKHARELVLFFNGARSSRK